MSDMLNERTSQDIANMVRVNRQQKLSRSKLFKHWVKFYTEWFNIQTELKDITILFQDGNVLDEYGDKNMPGATMILVAKEITVQVILQKLLDLNLWNESVKFPSEEIKEDREHSSAYLAYKESYLTLLDELLLECFYYYQKGEFLPYGNRIVGSSFCRSVTILIEGKRYRANIWSNYGSDNRKRIGIYTEKW